jgi:carotenoid cleavage dioxygenase-like enzyme
MIAAARPYLEGNYAPIHDELELDELQVIGELPRDLQGVYVRTGATPRFTPTGRHHWFDGDGMLHAVQFRDGRASYHNRWVRTKGFLAEEEAGHALWSGVTERPDFTNPRGPFKDTANTDLVYHAGRLLALWWLGGEPYRVMLPSLETCGVETYGGAVKTMSAHPKVDPVTGEMMFFDYKPYPPYLTYGIVDREGVVTHLTTIDLPGPRLQHDLAITERHTLFFDMAMMWDPELLAAGKTKVRFFRDRPSRIGVLPRHAKGDAIRWFEVPPFYMYHAVNAWEEGDTIVLVGCKIENPLAGDEANPRGREVPTIGFLRLEPALTRWRIDLVTGAVKEERIDDTISEFPRVDNRHLGRKSRFAYIPRIAAAPTLLFDGLIKYDVETGSSSTHVYEKGSFGGETPFAPRVGAKSEDDGYLVTFVADERSGATEVHVLDARDVSRPPIARVKIPRRVPTGYHAYWIPEADLGKQRAAF